MGGGVSPNLILVNIVETVSGLIPYDSYPHLRLGIFDVSFNVNLRRLLCSLHICHYKNRLSSCNCLWNGAFRGDKTKDEKPYCALQRSQKRLRNDAHLRSLYVYKVANNHILLTALKQLLLAFGNIFLCLCHQE